MSFELILFFVFAAASFVSGWAWLIWPARGSWLVMLVTTLVPANNALAAASYRFGLCFVDFLVLGILANPVFWNRWFNSRSRSDDRWLFAAVFVLALFWGVGLSSEARSIAMLRDLRPLLVLFELYVLGIAVREPEVVQAMPSPESWMVWFGIGAVVQWLLIHSGLIEIGVWYLDQPRVIGGGAFAATLYLGLAAYRSEQIQQRRVFAVVLLSLLLIAWSGTRALFAVAALVGMIAWWRSTRDMLGFVLVITLGAVALVGWGILTGDERFESLSAQAWLEHLAIRFSPALEWFERLDWTSLLIGFGVGTEFEIPWFDDLGYDPYSATVDSAYLTFFLKYGLMSVPVIVSTIAAVAWPVPERRTRYGVVVGMLVLSATNVLLYEMHAFPALVFARLLTGRLKACASQR